MSYFLSKNCMNMRRWNKAWKKLHTSFKNQTSWIISTRQSWNVYKMMKRKRWNCPIYFYQRIPQGGRGPKIHFKKITSLVKILLVSFWEVVRPIAISLQQQQVITCTYEHTPSNIHVSADINLDWTEIKIMKTKLSKLTNHIVHSDTILNKIGNPPLPPPQNQNCRDHKLNNNHHGPQLPVS